MKQYYIIMIVAAFGLILYSAGLSGLGVGAVFLICSNYFVYQAGIERGKELKFRYTMFRG